MRGRNNNRKGPNPLTRTYESNGPDVKIRGSAQQVADKYGALARDAQSAGDRVIAENYLQHAEHYNRIIAAANAQAQAQREMREERDDRDDGDDDTNERPRQNREGAPTREHANDGSGPQPVIEGTPAEVMLEERQAQPDKRRGRGRKPGNGSGQAAQEVSGESAGEDSASDAPRKKQARRPRKAAVSEERADGDGSGEAEGQNDNPLTAAAGE